MERGDVCLERTVERLYEDGMTPEEISAALGVDVGWIASLVALWQGEDM